MLDCLHVMHVFACFHVHVCVYMYVCSEQAVHLQNLIRVQSAYLHTLIGDLCCSYKIYRQTFHIQCHALFSQKKDMLKCCLLHFWMVKTFLKVTIQINAKRKIREKSRECHSHKPQSFPVTKRKRKQKKKKKKKNERKSNKRTKTLRLALSSPI